MIDILTQACFVECCK